jgi:hypothetical protein
MLEAAANDRELRRHGFTPVDREHEARELLQGDQYGHRDKSGEA